MSPQGCSKRNLPLREGSHRPRRPPRRPGGVCPTARRGCAGCVGPAPAAPPPRSPPPRTSARLGLSLPRDGPRAAAVSRRGIAPVIPPFRLLESRGVAPSPIVGLGQTGQHLPIFLPLETLRSAEV